MKTTSFLYYFSEKIISIDKIPPILQAFKVVLSCPTTEHGGIWVGPLLTSSKDMAQNTQETFDWGGVYMTPGRLSPRSEFTPVPSHGSIFVYMIPPQNVMPARVTPA